MAETPASPQPPDAPAPATPPAEAGSGPAHPAATGPAADYPLWADIAHQAEYRRLLPLVKWLLLVPHYVVLFFLAIGAILAVIVAFFSVLFTRRYPRGLFDYVVGVSRWGWRVGAYLLLMVDDYPPFSLADDPDYPARYVVAYPEQGVDRWRPLFAWILAIPYLLVANILMQLAQLLVFFAFFTILFTKKFPEGMFRIAEVALRWQVRGGAYAYWLTTRYPPFVWG